eukprot:gene17212-biopygen821
MRTDASTASATGQRVVVAHAAAKGNVLISMDVESAFLSGDAYEEGDPGRRIFVKVVMLDGEVYFYQLRKALYGLRDAPRKWNRKLHADLLSLGYQPLVADASMFIQTDENNDFKYCDPVSFDRRLGETWMEAAVRMAQLKEGLRDATVIAVHVDDKLVSVSPNKAEQVIAQLKTKFNYGKIAVLDKTGESTMHIGQKLTRVVDGYTLDQVQYTAALENLHVPADAEDKSLYEDPDDYRTAVGKLLWAGTRTRPDLAYAISRLASAVNAPTVGDARLANKTIARAQASEVVLKFPKLHDDLELLCFADASFGNNEDGTSQGGFAAILREEKCRRGMSNDEHFGLLLDWRSQRMRRIVHSTLGAEAIATGGAADASSWLKLLLTEVGLLHVAKRGADELILQPDWVLTDAMSVREVLETTKVPREKNLLLDVQRMRTLVEDGDLFVTHVPTRYQVADALTKHMTDKLLIRACKDNVIEHVHGLVTAPPRRQQWGGRTTADRPAQRSATARTHAPTATGAGGEDAAAPPPLTFAPPLGDRV